jgi:hypothetical protein
MGGLDPGGPLMPAARGGAGHEPAVPTPDCPRFWPV